jgi:hypothetical protein
MAVVFAVPFLGVIAYHALGRSRLPRWVRIAVVGGGTAVWLAGRAVFAPDRRRGVTPVSGTPATAR